MHDLRTSRISFYMVLPATLTVLQCLFMADRLSAQLADPWQSEYAAEQATGQDIIGLWQFNADRETEDSARGTHALKLNGATISPEGKFGSCLECSAGWPDSDQQHAAVAAQHDELSPNGAFTLEMWVNPKPEYLEYKGNCFLLDKKYVSHVDYQLMLDVSQTPGLRTLRLNLGFGEDSESWQTDDPVTLTPGTWTHVAVTYDGAGTATFYIDGIPRGRKTVAGRRSIAPGRTGLAIGDRLGSYYGGFPGYIDQVRISRGVREFRYASISEKNSRHAFLRGEPEPNLAFLLTNHAHHALNNATAHIDVAGFGSQEFPLGQIEPGAQQELRYPFNTRLRPDRYQLSVRITADIAGVADNSNLTIDSRETFDFVIVPRPHPDRLPVVMWGIGGIDGVLKELPRLKQIGFTHCLGLSCDYDAIWKAGEPVTPVTPRQLEEADKMLDAAVEHDLGIVISLSPGHWLDEKTELLRVGRDGKPYARKNAANAFPELRKFFYNVGAAAARQWGTHPAFSAALIDTEVRDGTAPSFHPAEREAFRSFAGYDIPDLVQQPWGVHYSQIDGFPTDRIVPDDHPILTYYRWFWKTGDGWNDWHTAMHEGFHSADESRKPHAPLWTFFDPAVRVPSLYGSGGDVDYISHWTYTYPDPQRIGLCTDELLAMARGSDRATPQQVMKMTQIIWYRSQTAPAQDASTPQAARSPWEDYDPDAAYITIAPMHLREALWTKLSRPIQGIMYHGWQSIVPGEKSAYRYTHAETQHELKRLVEDVIVPLGPTLKKIPTSTNDVAFLESFTSQMLGRRGTYGWGTSWTADCWLMLQHAHIQADIIYDETVIENGLKSYKVLLIPDGDVLSRSVADRILEFQRAGGIIVADERLAPGLTPDIRLTAYTRTKRADEDLAALHKMADELREQLGAKYTPQVDADSRDIIVQRRTWKGSDYVFAINDRREFGDYVGRHGLVMEQGLPTQGKITFNRSQPSHVYNLRRGKKVLVEKSPSSLSWNIMLPPCDGALYLVSPTPIEKVDVKSKDTVARGSSLSLEIVIADAKGKPVQAVIPLQVTISDPDGRPAEQSGYHAAIDGVLKLDLELAPNDVPGIWTVQIEEGAAGLTKLHAFRVTSE